MWKRKDLGALTRHHLARVLKWAQCFALTSIFFIVSLLHWEHTRQFRANKQMVKCVGTLGNFSYVIAEKVWQAVKGNFRCSGPWHKAVCCFLTFYQPACAVVEPQRVAQNGSCHPELCRLATAALQNRVEKQRMALFPSLPFVFYCGICMNWLFFSFFFSSQVNMDESMFAFSSG